MFRIHMQPTAPHDYRQTYPDRDASARHKIFFDELLEQGILLIYSGTGAISTPQGEPEIETTHRRRRRRPRRRREARQEPVDLWVPETRPWSLTCRDAGRC